MKSLEIKRIEKSLIKEAYSKNPLLTKEKLAEEIGVSVMTIYKLLKDYNIQSPCKTLRRPRVTTEDKCVKYLKSIGYEFD